MPTLSELAQLTSSDVVIGFITILIIVLSNEWPRMRKRQKHER